MSTANLKDFRNYLKVREAAGILGISPWTLRNWDRSGKLVSFRHPINGYRLYDRDDLDALLRRTGAKAERGRSEEGGAEGDKERTRTVGFDLHLVKPVDPDRIEAVLGEVGKKSDPREAHAG